MAFFVGIVPFALFPYATDLGEAAGISDWTAWLNVPFSAVVGWLFVSLEKVGENSSNPFEGRPQRRPDLRHCAEDRDRDAHDAGEESDLKPIEAKRNILF